ncbi:hypothetical protein BD770DRAFT_445314 [Pilaira anomala]|nr:hypothetical protein BD770DRAFT_445314 [Pilaira anomala]
MQPTFRQDNYKHIAFSASIGGSSHHHWVLSILDNLAQRGHNLSYLTTTNETRFSKPFSRIKTIDLGQAVNYESSGFMKEMSSGKPMTSMLPSLVQLLASNFERDYVTLKDYFKENQVDLVLCDHFMESCAEAATALNIPYIITSTLEFTGESDAPFINNEMSTMDDPTTEHQSFFTRFYNEFIGPWVGRYALSTVTKDIFDRKQALGIAAKLQSPREFWKDAFKLVNILFGYTPARRIGPLTEFVGPILSKQYQPLTEDLERYLNTHQHVAYIGFGQNAIPSKRDIQYILQGLMECLESGLIDGFIWSTYLSGPLFPKTISTSSGTRYNVEEMLNGTNLDARMMAWVPQTAVLLHPSTSLFLSHGGLGSWYESMYAGKPMMMFPFFGDQPGNALVVEREGLGRILKRDMSMRNVKDLYKQVLDETRVKENVKRMQALTQIHSEHGILRGADVVEEIAYTHKEGIIPHRVPVSERMSFIKSRNIDLYIAMVFILIATSCLFIILVWKAYQGLSNSKKLKLL